MSVNELLIVENGDRDVEAMDPLVQASSGAVEPSEPGCAPVVQALSQNADLEESDAESPISLTAHDRISAAAEDSVSATTTVSSVLVDSNLVRGGDCKVISSEDQNGQKHNDHHNDDGEAITSVEVDCSATGVMDKTPGECRTIGNRILKAGTNHLNGHIELDDAPSSRHEYTSNGMIPNHAAVVVNHDIDSISAINNEDGCSFVSGPLKADSILEQAGSIGKTDSSREDHGQLNPGTNPDQGNAVVDHYEVVCRQPRDFSTTARSRDIDRGLSEPVLAASIAYPDDEHDTPRILGDPDLGTPIEEVQYAGGDGGCGGAGAGETDNQFFPSLTIVSASCSAEKRVVGTAVEVAVGTAAEEGVGVEIGQGTGIVGIESPSGTTTTSPAIGPGTATEVVGTSTLPKTPSTSATPPGTPPGTAPPGTGVGATTSSSSSTTAGSGVAAAGGNKWLKLESFRWTRSFSENFRNIRTSTVNRMWKRSRERKLNG